MRRRAAIVFVLSGLAALAVAAPALAQLFLLAPVLPSPADVVRVIDHLTKKESDTSVDVKLGKTTGQGKLLIARTRVDVAMERSSRNWRGRVVVHMTVPSDISYSVDLSSIKPEQIRLDARERRLIVAMPTPQVEDVTPLLTEVKVKNDFNRARFKRLDMDTSRELQNAMLREDYQARARKKGAEELAKIREEGRAALEAFLQRLLQGTYAGIKVVVE
jgi:hypothetical protein